MDVIIFDDKENTGASAVRTKLQHSSQHRQRVKSHIETVRHTASAARKPLGNVNTGDRITGMGQENGKMVGAERNDVEMKKCPAPTVTEHTPTLVPVTEDSDDEIEKMFVGNDDEDDSLVAWAKADRPSSFLRSCLNWRPACLLPTCRRYDDVDDKFDFDDAVWNKTIDKQPSVEMMTADVMELSVDLPDLDALNDIEDVFGESSALN